MSNKKNTDKPVSLDDNCCRYCRKPGQFITRFGAENKYHFYALISEKSHIII